MPVLATTIQTLLDSVKAAQDLVNSEIHPLLSSDVHANYQASYLHSRLDDVRIVIERLGISNARSIVLSNREDILRPQIRPRRNFSKRVQKVMQEQYVLVGQMRHDYESLFIYGNLALDHWARVTGALCGVRIKHFADLYHILNKPNRPTSLDIVFSNHNDKIIWLYYNLRAHRNGFIEHLNRPMQGGSTRPAHSLGFSLFTPSASGTVSDVLISNRHTELLRIGVDLMVGMPDDHWQRTKPLGTLQFLLRLIQHIPGYDDKEKIGMIWQELGGETVSYEILAGRMLELLTSAPDTLR